MPIIGTAGHVDHGKSTLVKALTGIDPDRLAEEKRRGMTIDLGFAHLVLPDGTEAGIVDVPGHARFLPNMLAGVHGMDAVLLVVAADEGVMPQTGEHLDILGLLDVRRLVVALTKVDVADAPTADAAEAEVSAELSRRGLSAEVVRVAAPAGEGVEAVRAALAALVAAVAVRDGGAGPRLPVDRAFVMAGFGPVVTGSLLDGALEVGQEVELAPSGLRARVRGLQQHGRTVDRATPGNRVAVNLNGVDRADIRRGQVLAPPGSLPGTTRVDVRLRVLPSAGAALAHNSRVAVFSGSAEVAARVVLLKGDELSPGDEGWVQLRLAAPMPLREDDVVVLRRPSPAMTIAGGRAVDVSPDAHRRGRGDVVSALGRRENDDGRLADELRRARAGATAGALAGRLARDPAAVEAALGAAVDAGAAVRVGAGYFDVGRWADIEATASAELERFHRGNPTRAGLARDLLGAALGMHGRALSDAVDVLATRGVLETRGTDMVAATSRVPTLSDAQAEAVDDALARLADAPLSPPRAAELAPGGLDDNVRRFLEEQGLAVRVAPDILMLPAAVEDAAARLRLHLEARGAVTVAEARDILGSSRRTVVPLLEYFDSIHLTRRDGDVRRLRD